MRSKTTKLLIRAMYDEGCLVAIMCLLMILICSTTMALGVLMANEQD